MDINQRKEKFGEAYLRAVAAVAGFTLYKPEVDDDSVDWGIAARGTKLFRRRPRVELQLKCTATDVLRDEELHYDLSVRNYEHLRERRLLVPRILVVVRLPTDIGHWLEQTERELALRHCAYWVSLHGREPTANTRTVRIALPRLQVLSVEELRMLMATINLGDSP
ncbi:DUF4365 domain-containing protein [Archangium gephyra]|nr:DUF4365 domain-containing protein [Archangium gephyra]AKI98867.1 Hypothetical protein AA314_00494 [Archangium gephyra]